MDYQAYRRKTKQVMAGGVAIGGTAPVSVQSMTNTDPCDFAATLAQVNALAQSGCDIVRLAVPDKASARVFAFLKEAGVKVPLVADIHFDYRIALEAVASGADKIRINPGNIGGRDRVRAVVDACKGAGVPIRIGVNSGSLEKSLLEKYGSPTPEALAQSAMGHVKLLEAEDFSDIVISVKSSDVHTMIRTNERLAELCDYPLHLGVTEAGAGESGTVKGAVGIGALLSRGIGDTIRVSLTDNPVREVETAKAILSSLGIGERTMDIVSCPTCGRTKIDLIPLLDDFKQKCKAQSLDRLPLKVAFMGCAVNGPGEAREADVGIAGGINEALLFCRGEILGKYPASVIVDVLIDKIKSMAN